MIPATSYIEKILLGDDKAIARGISLIENEVTGYEELLNSLPLRNIPVIGITGPPGAGKSTLIDLMIDELITDGKKIAVLCIDPSSPFRLGALLGDRIRMSKWYNHPSVFIRSLATRGVLGGLSPKVIEITDLLKVAGFDFIIIETVGVGQSEVEIANLADLTVVVLVPEAGDEIQTMKAGLMEIADIFVINKCDRPGAELFEKNFQHLLRLKSNEAEKNLHIIKTIASQNRGIEELTKTILQQQLQQSKQQKISLLVEKAYHLIAHKRMRGIDKNVLIKKIEQEMEQQDFNLYRMIKEFD